MDDKKITQTEQTITIIGTIPGTTRGPGQNVVERAVDVTHVHANFERFLQSLKEIVDVGVPHIGTFELDEVSFSAEITANGDFKLLGIGTGVEAKGGVTFKLRQKLQDQHK